MKNNLIKKFIAFSFGGYISALLSFFTLPIVTRMVSPEQYGIFSIATLVANLSLLIIGLGLDQGFVRFFYEEKEEKRSGLLFNSLKVPMIIFVIYGAVLLLFKEKISHFVYGEYNYNMIILLGILVLFSLINRFSILIIRMNQRGFLFSICQIIQALLSFILVFPFFKIYGDNYKSLYISSVMAIVIVTILTIALERKFWNFKNRESTIPQKELFKFSLPLIVTIALTWVFQGFDKIAIKMYANMNELGLYAGAFKIVALLTIIQSGFTTFWVPIAYERYTKNNEEKQFFEQVNEYISFLMFGVAVVLLMSKDLIILLLGEKFREAAQIMPTLIMMPIMYAISETTVLGINFTKQSKKHLYISVAAALFNVIGNMILVPKYGAKGAAISTGLAYILFFSLRTHFSLKLIKYNFNLKKIYIITGLLMGYAIYLSFYNNKIITYIAGMGILVILLLTYKNVVQLGVKLIINIVKNYKN